MTMEEVMAKAAKHGVDIDMKASYRRPNTSGPFKSHGGVDYRASATIYGAFGSVVVRATHAGDTPQGAMERLRDTLIEASSDFNNAALWLSEDQVAP